MLLTFQHALGGANVYVQLCWVYTQEKLLGHRLQIWFALVNIANHFSRVFVLGEPLNLNFRSD